jgi:hypothetical protein
MQGGEARRRGRFIAPIADLSALRLILDSFVNHHKMGNLAHNFLPLLEYPLDNKNESSWVLKNVRPGFMIWNNSKIYSLKIVLISLF